MNDYLSKTIIKIAEIDQEARFMENVDPKIKKFLIYSIDSAHSHRIRGYIRDYGYPSKEIVGEAALHMFWLLIQHQDFDLILMEDCHNNCIFSPEDTAYLMDRIKMTKGLPQIYGTQFHMEDEIRTIYPIENIEAVDVRRSEKGMESLESYITSQDQN